MLVDCFGHFKGVRKFCPFSCFYISGGGEMVLRLAVRYFRLSCSMGRAGGGGGGFIQFIIIFGVAHQSKSKEPILFTIGKVNSLYFDIYLQLN